MAEQSESPGYIFETVDPLPSEYECPICMNILCEPRQIFPCGHRFCQACLIQVLRQNSPRCPLDNNRITFDQVFPDVARGREAQRLQVKCCNSSQGCQWTGELLYAQKHRDACPMEKIKCSNDNCEKMIERRYFKTHTAFICEWRKMKCQYCNKDYVYSQDHMAACQLLPIACLNRCDLLLPRHKMTDHINNQCPMTIVECAYRDVGCEDKMKRCELDNHLENSKTLHKMCQENKELKRKCDDIEKRIGDQEKHLQQANGNPIRQLNAQEKEIKQLKDELQQLNLTTQDEREHIKRRLDEQDERQMKTIFVLLVILVVVMFKFCSFVPAALLLITITTIIIIVCNYEHLMITY